MVRSILVWKTKAGLSLYVPGGIAIMNAFWVKHPALGTRIPRPQKTSEKLFWVGLMTMATVADMAMRWAATFPELWWFGPVLAHAILENLHDGKKCQQISN